MDGETLGPSLEELSPEDLKTDKEINGKSENSATYESGKSLEEQKLTENIKGLEQKSYEEVLESIDLEPLSEVDDALLKMDLIKISQNAGSYSQESLKEEKEYLWKVVSQYGEKAVPAIMDHFGDGYSPELSKLLDTLVTEKTAPLVLKAIQDKKIGLYEGALAASEGGEATAGALGRMLTELQVPNPSGRGDQVRLLEALANAKDETTIPAITTFWKNLRSNPDYDSYVHYHLDKVGTNLYNVDAYDIVRTIAQIGGQTAHEALLELSESGDEFIEEKASKALEGQLYVGHTEKYLIREPEGEIKQYEEDLYEDLTEEKFEHENEIKVQPESLVSAKDISLLDWEKLDQQEVEPKMRAILESFFDKDENPHDVVEKLVNLGNQPEQITNSQVAKAEIFLQALKDLDKLPNLEALRMAFKEHVNPEVLKSKGYDSETIDDIKHLTRPFGNSLDNASQEDFRLPESANQFTMVSKRLGKTREIGSFVDQLKKRLHHRYVDKAIGVFSGGKNATAELNGAFLSWRGFIEEYRSVSYEDVPIYDEAGKRLSAIAKNKPEYFYGRDADYFYYAIKAQRLGLVDGKKPKLIYVDRPLAGALRSNRLEDQDDKERVMSYLLQEKLSADGIHLDTGYKGSVPEAVIKALNPNMPMSEINENIKLLQTDDQSRRLRSGGGVGQIEDRAKRYGSIEDIYRDEQTGRLKVRFHIPSEGEKLKAWVVQQAVTRHFVPKAA